MKKFFLSFLSVVLLSLFVCATPSCAQTENQWLEYDIATETGTKEFHTFDESGEELILSIEPVSELRQTRLSAGTYKVSKKSTGSWEASYNVRVNQNNCFISANNLNLKALKGSVLSSSLDYTSKKATCSFKHKVGIITTSASVVATISSGKLIVK